MAIAVVLLGSMWLGLFSHKHVEYANDLWWQFAVSGDAPRFLRATVGVIGGALIFAIGRLVRPAPGEPAPPDEQALEYARTVIDRSGAIEANLALLGDKALLFNERRDAFIMYGGEGRSWIALGDRVGARQEQEELAWQFRALVIVMVAGPYSTKSDRSYFLSISIWGSHPQVGRAGTCPAQTFSLKGEGGKKFPPHDQSHREKWRYLHRRPGSGHPRPFA